MLSQNMQAENYKNYINYNYYYFIKYYFNFSTNSSATSFPNLLIDLLTNSFNTIPFLL